MTAEEAVKAQAILAVEDFMQREEYQELIKLAEQNPECKDSIEWVLRSVKRQLVQYIVTLNVASKLDAEKAKNIIKASRKLTGQVMASVLQEEKEKVKSPLRLVKS